MKKVCAAILGLTMLGTAANAGGIIVEVPPAVIIEDTAASNQGIFVPVFALLLLLLLHVDG